ncbi:Metalloprotease [Aspergillus stella-maris]|uniref:Metalloprotease n=1 Tax=Aspergillus stella-maris TaxID=1810926 RepID=UPI003CCD93AC
MGCPTATATANLGDINTSANFGDVSTRHTELELAIDFDHAVVTGTTTIHAISLIDGLTTMVLDTSHLLIRNVRLGESGLEWELGPLKDQNGRPLYLRLDREYHVNETFKVEISFETTSQSTGLQWFTPVQTDDKKYPFLFSQGEPVHARSIFPCQDTPSVKTTFQITIHSVLPVVASGVPHQSLLFPPLQGELTMQKYTFTQDIPISNYLFAVASGNMVGAQIAPKSYVYAAPGFIDACKAEFESDIQAIIDAGEELIFKNPWPLYNLVVLPKSFHLGGMENPVFNFYSATVVSGDGENISVVAHEFAHTFSGNLVTNFSWEHFWLNEGWTVYIEREILRKLRGDEEVTFQAIVGWNELVYNVAAYGGSNSIETSLVLQFQGKRPDDVMSKIAYEKGYTFLCFLEGVVGRGNWLRFIPHYFRLFSKRTITSYTFKHAVLDFFASNKDASRKLNSTNWDTWFHSPGLPPKPPFQSTLYDNCINLAKWWTSPGTPKTSPFKPDASDVQGWTAGQFLVFLDLLLDRAELVTLDAFRLLGPEYGVERTRNFEILARYLRLGLEVGDEKIIGRTEAFLGETGRMKFVRPLFEALLKQNRGIAQEVFRKYRGFYHPTCTRLIEGLL